MSTVKIEQSGRTATVTIDGEVVAVLVPGGTSDNIAFSVALDLVAHVAKNLGAKVER